MAPFSGHKIGTDSQNVVTQYINYMYDVWYIIYIPIIPCLRSKMYIT